MGTGMSSPRLAKKLLLIGWDGADWQIIKPLLARGEMPALQSLIEQGVMGNLASMRPMISPMLWTTMATGKSPYYHGIHGFSEPAPHSETGIRLVTSTSRKCKAFWNILTQSGIPNHVVSWFAGHPSEPINGICVSEQFAKATQPLEKGWPVPKGSVHPTNLSEQLGELRIHPGDFSLDDFRLFIPSINDYDAANDRNVRMLAVQLAECATNQAIATWIMENQNWEMVSVYFNTIDHLSHGFMYFHPPRMDHIPPAQFERYKECIDTTYRLHDMMLSRLLKLAGDDTTVMLVSDHGYQTGNRRPRLTPSEPTGPVVWHRPYGIFVLKGPHIRQDELVFGARILDVAPTVLTLLGLPIGADMQGVPLVQVFDHDVIPEVIPSWEEVPGEAGMHSGELQSDPQAEMVAFNQLVELGYVEPGLEDKQANMQKVADECHYNLGCSLMSNQRYAEAIELLEEVHQRQPKRLNVAFNLVECYQLAGRIDDCRKLIEFIAAGNCSDPGMEDKRLRVVPQTDLLRGLLELNVGETELALEYLLKAEQAMGPRHRGLSTNIGKAYLRLERFEDAGRAFEKALELDPDDPEAHFGMALVFLSMNRNQMAIDNLLRSVEIIYQQPAAHYYLGLAFTRVGNRDAAVRALEISLKQRPENPEASKLLSAICQAG
jgi:predicted AlkP superfamily phosphohydrolase/phosphomutase/tetratricopeptide (TPR) repeat protein